MFISVVLTSLVILSEAKDVMLAAGGDEILRCAQDDKGLYPGLSAGFGNLANLGNLPNPPPAGGLDSILKPFTAVIRLSHNRNKTETARS